MGLPWRERLRSLRRGAIPAQPTTLPPARPGPWLDAESVRLAAGDVTGVEQRARARLAEFPGDADGLALLAAVDRRRGDAVAARGALERIVETHPEHAYAHAELAAVLEAAGEREGALDHCLLARAFDPDSAGAAIVEARLQARDGDAAGALETLDAAGTAARNAEWQSARAGLLTRLDRAAEAVTAYRQLLAQAPDSAAAWANLGLVYLNQLGDAAQAVECCRRATVLAPALAGAQANLALALDAAGQGDEALAHLEALLRAQPGVAEYRWNRAVLRLARGDFAGGWDDYEARNQRGNAGAPPRQFPFAEWGGDALGDRALLVYGEQGLGDEIMFASCLPDALARAGAAAVVIECDERLAPLYARSFPGARVHGARRDGDRRWLAAHPDLACQIAVASLPRLFRRSADAFPRHAGYLRADPVAVARWRAWLAAGGGGRAVGMAWRGGTATSRAALRTMPLPFWDGVLRAPGVRWVVLQRDARADELAAIRAMTGVPPLRPDLAPDDVDGQAALVAALDGIVTVDSTLAHLAGALGRPVSIALPLPADWRWGRAGTSSVWYPSVRLCRQPVPGAWAPVAAALAAGVAA
jgi:tetratricopeptide (TPR) repeat protein